MPSTRVERTEMLNNGSPPRLACRGGPCLLMHGLARASLTSQLYLAAIPVATNRTQQTGDLLTHELCRHAPDVRRGSCCQLPRLHPADFSPAARLFPGRSDSTRLKVFYRFFHGSRPSAGTFAARSLHGVDRHDRAAAQSVPPPPIGLSPRSRGRGPRLAAPTA